MSTGFTERSPKRKRKNVEGYIEKPTPYESVSRKKRGTLTTPETLKFDKPSTLPTGTSIGHTTTLTTPRMQRSFELTPDSTEQTIKSRFGQKRRITTSSTRRNCFLSWLGSVRVRGASLSLSQQRTFWRSCLQMVGAPSLASPSYVVRARSVQGQ
jgi:hypothetical protein